MFFEICFSIITLFILAVLIKRNIFKFEIQKPIKKTPEDFIEKLKKFNFIQYSPASPTNFSILSYNILTQKYMKKKNCKELSLENRIKKILIEITSLNPDIICLQESNYEVYKRFLKPSLSSDYIIITFDNYDSYLMNVIGIKKRRFKLIKDYNFDLKSINIDVVGNRGAMGVEIEDLMVKDKKIFVINTHFPWKPIYEYEKAKIMQFLFDFILQRDNDYVILAGDFNSLVNSIVVRMVYFEQWGNEINGNMNYIKDFKFNHREIELIENMKNKMIKKENFRNKVNELLESSKKIYDKYHLRSAYDEYLIEKKNDYEIKNKYYFLRKHPNFTNYTANFRETIDYIFYSKSLQKIKIGTFPSENEIPDFLPNEVFPSDHLKLFAQFGYYY